MAGKSADQAEGQNIAPLPAQINAQAPVTGAVITHQVVRHAIERPASAKRLCRLAKGGIAQARKCQRLFWLRAGTVVLEIGKLGGAKIAALHTFTVDTA